MALFDLTESLYRLFVRETQGQSLKESEQPDDSIATDKNFLSWMTTKRDFSRPEICEANWIKTCPQGYVTEVEFSVDGTLVEQRLFDRFETIGFWSIEEGTIKVTIHKGEHRYEFRIIANRENNIHSAIEYKDSELHSYLKLAQVRSNFLV